MKQFRLREFIWVTLVLSLIFGVILFFAHGLKPIISWSLLGLLPTIVTLDMLFWTIFFKYLWKYKVFQGWLVPFSNLQGTWIGTLKSNWVNPETNQPIAPIQTCLVIRQTFTTISCAIYTSESESLSFSAAFAFDEDSGKKKLIYNYRNNPRVTVRHKSEMHFGTTVLDIIGSPVSRLGGEYWTTRGTAGEVALEFSNVNTVSSFAELSGLPRNVSG